jgi:hypothetical protein
LKASNASPKLKTTKEGIGGMKKHILAKHPTIWCRWKIVNQSLTVEEQQQENFKMKSMVGYRAITYHFQATTPY